MHGPAKSWRKKHKKNRFQDFMEVTENGFFTQETQEKMAGATGLEPAASSVTGWRYNQLNYTPARFPICKGREVFCQRLMRKHEEKLY